MKKVIKMLEKISLSEVLIAVWIIVSWSYVGLVFINNSTVLDGKTLAALQKSKENLMIENQELKNEIARESSLRVIEVKAKRLGFKPMEVEWFK